MLSKYSAVTPYLTFTVAVYLQGALLYGIDTGSFGSLQALPSFLRTFGHYDSDPEVDAYVLPAGVKAAANSIPFAGQAVGAVLSSNMVDAVGYKLTMVVLAIVQVVAIIIELTSNLTASWGQLTAGRFLAYVATGLAEMAVTQYCAEIAPAKMRGLASGSMVLFNGLGNLWGSGMSRAYATETRARGWIIPQAVQFIPAVLILMLIWFTPESPRFLLQKNRPSDALRALNRLRPNRDVDNGYTAAEIKAIEVSLEESKGHSNTGNMLRRTWIAWSMFVFLQFTGIQFVNTFGGTFYVAQGLGANSFTYLVIGNVLQIVFCLFQIIMYDFWGRRIFAILGGIFCFIFLSVVAVIGPRVNPSPAGIHTLVACIILTQAFGRFSITNAFVIGAEIGGVKMRRKIMATGGLVNMCCAILITSAVPYLMGPGNGTANLGAKVGWFFAAPSAILAFFGVFLVPELRGRSLEEVDELYNAGLKWGWQFKNYQTTGAGAQIAAIENEDHEKLRRLSIKATGTGGPENVTSTGASSVDEKRAT